MFKVVDGLKYVITLQDFRVLVLAPSSLERFLY